MRPLALAVAGLIVALGVVGVVVPDTVIAIGRFVVSPGGLYAAAGLRVGTGLVLMLAARESRAPGMLRAIGAAVFVSGLATPLFGVEGARARLDWEAAHLTFLRFEAAAFVCLGGIIVSVVLPSAAPIVDRE